MTGAGRPLVVTFGEMLMRLSPGEGSRLFESDRMRVGFGGAEANVAVSLAYFDIQSEYVTRLPESLVGDAAVAALMTEGVLTQGIVRGAERMGIYFVEPGADVANSRVVYDRAGSAFAAIVPAMLEWPKLLAGAGWFHATGITAALGPGPLATLDAGIAAARAAGVPTSVDLNFRPALWSSRDPVPIIAPLVRGVDLLIGNCRSVRAMLGLEMPDDALATPDAARSVAARIAEQTGCRRVALTQREVRGPGENRWSAVLFDTDSATLTSSAPWTVQVVDRIGGGDAFAAALIAELLRGCTGVEALEFALAASALKLRIAGDFNRVTRGDVDRFMHETRAAKVSSGRVPVPH